MKILSCRCGSCEHGHVPGHMGASWRLTFAKSGVDPNKTVCDDVSRSTTE